MRALCDEPVDIDNGTVTFNGTLVGDMATYTCDSGFELIGDATRTCTLVNIDSAEFLPAPPSCEFTEYTTIKCKHFKGLYEKCIVHMKGVTVDQHLCHCDP